MTMKQPGYPLVKIGSLSLSEPGAFKIGPFGSSLKKDELTKEGIPVVGIENVLANSFVPAFRRFISQEKFEQLSQYLIKPGDVLVTTMGTVGRAAVVPHAIGTAIIDSHLFRMRVDHSKVNPTYLCFGINGFIGMQQEISQMASGAIMAGLNTKILKECSIPLPSLSEQQRIAMILTEQMAAVNHARAAAEAQLEAAKALPATYLRAIFNSSEAQQWPRKKLGDVLQLRKEVIHPYDNLKGPAIFVGLEHIESLTGNRIGSVDLEMSQLTGRKPRFLSGDIVYGYLRPYLNKVWVAEFDGLCSVDQYVYSVHPDLAVNEFVAWFMRSPVFLDRAPIGTTPGQLPRIRTAEVALVEINLPDLDEQTRVLAMIRGQMTETERTRNALVGQLATINALPEGLLRQAFSGGL